MNGPGSFYSGGPAPLPTSTRAVVYCGTFALVAGVAWMFWHLVK